MATAPTTNGKRKVTINPVTRVEGHGKVTLHLDEAGHIEQARFHIIEFRGFERFVQGRFYWEAPVIVQRLCGICPVSHHLAAAKATDVIVGADQLTPTGEKMRRLMHYGQTYQSHAMHFYHLASPDLLFGFDAPVEKRNVIGVIQDYPEAATQAVLMRKYGQEVIKATSGKKVHGTGAIPGGINKNLSIAERDALAKDIDKMVEWSIAALELCKKITIDGGDTLLEFGSFPSNHVSIVREDGCLDLYDGKLRAKDAEGGLIFDQVAPADYLDYIGEEVRPWSYMKFPHILSLGKDKGWYRVGPLARINNCDYIDTPIAEKERQGFMALGGGKPINSTMAYHWARMIELVHSAEKMQELLKDPDLQGTDLVTSGERRSRGVAWVEAPRGTLFHHYEVDPKTDQIKQANLIVSTTHNNEAMNKAVRVVAKQYLDGQEITEGLLNHIEVGIRAYDPCLSCATHALGQMRLHVQLVDAEGTVVDERLRGVTNVAGNRVLVIGYGNPGRQDDGLGPALTQRLEDLGLEGVTVDADYQLNIEDAADMAEHDVVLFVDASVNAQEPFEHRAVRPASEISFTSHSVSPESVLAMCEEHFGATPKTFVLAIRGYEFEFEEGLTTKAQDNLEEAFAFVLEQVRAWKEETNG